LQKDQLQDEMAQKKNAKVPASHSCRAFSVYQKNSFSKN